MINKDLKHTSKINQIPYTIKSTMSYKRYALSKEEIQDLLDSIDK